MKWLKQAVKEDIIGFMLLCFMIGTAFIWLGTGYHLLHLSNGEELNGTVLWLTSLAIFWYAYETYQLKQSSSQQVDLQEEIMLNEFLPILEPLAKNSDPVIKNGVFNKLCLRNLGLGPAKYIVLHIGTEKVAIHWSLAGGEEELVRLEPAARRKVQQQLSDAPDNVRVRIVYEDIYGRRFRTENIFLDKAPRGRSYRLRQGTWDFKRLPKTKH